MSVHLLPIGHDVNYKLMVVLFLTLLWAQFVPSVIAANSKIVSPYYPTSGNAETTQV